MSRRDFAMIARIIHGLNPGPERNAIALRFAQELTGSHPLFDEVRFLQAALGVQPETVAVLLTPSSAPAPRQGRGGRPVTS